MVKSGWKTTEFWVTLAVNVGLLSSAIAGVLPPEWAAVATAVSVLAYSISRGLAKSKGTANGQSPPA